MQTDKEIARSTNEDIAKIPKKKLSLGKKIQRFFIYCGFIRSSIIIVYIISAIYTLIMLPYGIILSNDLNNPEAMLAPTPVYLIILTIFVAGFLFPKISKRRRISAIMTKVAGIAILLYIHFLFVSANISG